MPQAAAEALESQDRQDELSREVTGSNELNAVRGKIDILLNTFERQRLATSETVSQYRKAAQADKTLEGLQGFYYWIGNKWQEALHCLNGAQAEITQAVQQGIAGENDREFLMRALILTDRHDFVGKADQIRDALREKIERLRRDRQAYDQIKNHKLVANTGFLKTDENTKIPVPNERDFLKLTVPERRELLKKFHAALPAAERYVEKVGGHESADLVKQYDKLLNDAQHKRRIIGAKTAGKFRDGFKKVDRQDKQEWIREFEVQMERYEKLWRQIRKTLKDKPLEHLESKRDDMGYTQLFAEYGRVCEQEGKTICGQYDQALAKLNDERIISAHTRDAFSRELRAQDFEGKQRYRDGLEQQVVRYRQLRGKIDQLKDKNARAELDALYDSPDHGYKEILARYNELTAPGAAPAGKPAFETKMQKLSNIRRERVRKNVIWGEELLDTREKKEKMVQRLDKVVRLQQEQQYDQSSYASSVQDLRRERAAERAEAQGDAATPGKPSLFRRLFGKKQSEQPAKGQSDESQSVASLRAQNRQLQQESPEGMRVTTKADDAFHMTRVDVGPTEKKVIRFGIGDKRAVQAFLQEDVHLEDRDQIHLMAKEGTVDRMKLEEIRHYRDYLKEQLQAA